LGSALIWFVHQIVIHTYLAVFMFPRPMAGAWGWTTSCRARRTVSSPRRKLSPAPAIQRLGSRRVLHMFLSRVGHTSRARPGRWMSDQVEAIRERTRMDMNGHLDMRHAAKPVLSFLFLFVCSLNTSQHACTAAVDEDSTLTFQHPPRRDREDRGPYQCLPAVTTSPSYTSGEGERNCSPR